MRVPSAVVFSFVPADVLHREANTTSRGCRKTTQVKAAFEELHWPPCFTLSEQMLTKSLLMNVLNFLWDTWQKNLLINWNRITSMSSFNLSAITCNDTFMSHRINVNLAIKRASDFYLVATVGRDPTKNWGVTHPPVWWFCPQIGKTGGTELTASGCWGSPLHSWWPGKC